MGRINKLVKHIVKGTVNRRIEFEKVKKNAIKNEAEWQRFIGSKSDTTFKKQNLFDNITLKLYSNSHLSRNLFRGDFEYQEIKFLQSFLKEGDVFVDIGANIGYFSVVASKAVGSSGKVHAFEPTDITYERLEESLELNNCKNVVLHKVALSNKKEEREFVTSNDGFDAYNSLGNPSQGSNFSKKLVTTDAYDNYSKESNILSPILVKIDVEGWEIPVIEGMKETLTSDTAPILMVEFTEDNAVLSGHSCSDLFELISSYGYQLYKYNWVRNELVKEENKKYFSYSNLLCIKNTKDFKTRLKNITIL